MKKINLIIVSILLASNLFAAETWSIFNKSEWEVVNIDPSANYQWGTVHQDGPAANALPAFKKFITQYPNFVRLRKGFADTHNGTFYMSSNVNNAADGTFHGAIKKETSYTIELKIQVKDVTDLISDPDYALSGNKTSGAILSHEIRPRLFGFQPEFFIIYDAVNEEYCISNNRLTGTDNINIKKRFDKNFEETPHTYRIEYTYSANAEDRIYTVFVDDIAAFTEKAHGSAATNANILIMGANSYDLCNMDVYYVKMKTTGASTWDILDKNMDGLAVSKGSSISSGAYVTKATDAIAGIDYINIKKEGNIAGNNAQFYVTTTSCSPRSANDYNNRIGTSKIVDGEAYALEVKARIPEGSTAVGSQIGLRLFNDKSMGIILGDGTISAAKENSTGIEADPDLTVTNISTSDWHDYGILVHADKNSYDIFVDGNKLFSNLPTLSPVDGSGVNLIKLGAESWADSDMDVASVKMGTYKPEISSVALSHNSHVTTNESTVTATANTTFIANGEKLLFTLVDESDNEIVTAVEGTVTNNVTTADIVIPANVDEGQYVVKVIANGQIGGIDVTSKTAAYEILNNIQTSTSNTTHDEIISISATILNANQTLTIKSVASNVSLSEVTIYSLTGNEVYRKSTSGNEFEFLTFTLTGMYVLNVRLNNDTSRVFKILVK